MIQKLIRKLLYVYTYVKHPEIERRYKYFIRDNYYCRLNQIRYAWKDRVAKNPYKVIEYQSEFDQELKFVIPFAYWHYLNGTLKKTISCKNTKEFYFFSQNHEEKYSERNWEFSYNNFEVPNMTHSINFSYKKWKTVPYKEHYKNEMFKFQKPTLVIANKYNIEWDEPPINYFDIPTLNEIISSLKDKYQIIYNRPLSTQIVDDNSDILDLKEYEWLHEEFPDVILLNDLYEKHKKEINNFNHLQLLVYANCSNFISIHGGTATLCCCFGGQNLIFSKRGIEHYFNEYESILPTLSGAAIHHAKNEQDVLKYIRKYY